MMKHTVNYVFLVIFVFSIFFVSFKYINWHYGWTPTNHQYQCVCSSLTYKSNNVYRRRLLDVYVDQILFVSLLVVLVTFYFAFVEIRIRISIDIVYEYCRSELGPDTR